jgi:hypothetical protein
LGSDANKAILTLDTKAPGAPTFQLDPSNPGSPASGSTTNPNPLISGTAEALARIKVEINSKTYTTTANAQGAWSATVTNPLPASGFSGTAYNATITATDAAGNSTTVNGAPFFVVLDATGAIKHDSSNDTGVSISDNITANPQPVIEGHVPGNASLVEVILDGKKYSSNPSDTTATGGLITLSDKTSLAGAMVRTYSFTAKALAHSNGVKYVPIITTQVDGLISSINGTGFEVDLQAPLTDAISGGIKPDSTHDTGLSTTDGRTQNTQPTLSGTGEPLARVRVDIQNASGATLQTLSGEVGSDGTWTLPLASALDGSGANGQSYTPVITITDKAGNSTRKSGTVFTIDTTPPVAPQDAQQPRLAGGLSSASDNGDSQTDNTTSLTTPMRSGRAEARAKVSVSLTTPGSGSTPINLDSTLADANGDWQVAVPANLALGTGT